MAKKRNLYGLVLVLSLIAMFSASPCSGQVVSMPDMNTWLSQHDLVYEVSPDIWDAGIHLANGDIGAVIWFDGSKMNISLDKRDIDDNTSDTDGWDPQHTWQNFVAKMDAGDKKGACNILSRDGQWAWHPPVGRLIVDFGSSLESFKGRFKLADASGEGQFVLDGQPVKMSCFIPPTRNVLVVTLEFADASPSLAMTTRTTTEILPDPPYPQYAPAEPYGDGINEIGWRQLQHAKGKEFVVRCAVDHPAPNKTVLYVALTSSLEGANPAGRIKTLLSRAKQDGVAKLYAEHSEWWQKYWPKSFISVPDSTVENLHYLGLYHLGACAHRDKHWPMGLSSPWAPDSRLGPGSGNTHFDLPMYFWGAFTSNHLDAVDAYCDWGYEKLDMMETRGRNFFGKDAGAWLGLCVAPDGTILLGGCHWTSWAGNGAWMAYSYWQRYLYTRDNTFLAERAYPVMNSFMDTYLTILRKEDDGLIHVPWSTSPEFGWPESWGPDGTADLALVRFLAEALLETVDILNISDPKESDWQNVLDNLVDFPQSAEHGLYLWRDRPYDQQHRHLTHMFPFHPLNQISVYGSAEDQALIEQTLDTFLSHQDFTIYGDPGWPNWSDIHLAAVYARIADGENCYTRLKNYEDIYVGPVGLSVNNKYVPGESSNTMVLEASLGYPAVVMDMLLQSWGGVIRLFPAIPGSWNDASFCQLRTEGAFLVSSRLEAGQVAFVGFESTAGGACRVANPFGQNAKLYDWPSGTQREFTETNGIIEFATSAGETYLLLPDDVPFGQASPQLYLPSRPAEETNEYGLHGRNL